MSSSSKKEETDLFDLLKELARNWKIMIPCIIVAGILGVFVAMWIRPVYQVDALLQIESKNNKSMGMTGGLSSLFATTSPAETEIELIKSRQIIGEAVEKMNLQYVATPINKLDRLLHREGRMELSRFEVPWKLLPKDEKKGPWTVKATDSTTYDLYDHHNIKVLSGTVGETYRFPYANDKASIHIYRMDVNLVVLQ
jgi:tyrosine-protein kinase Etk/Wzc